VENTLVDEVTDDEKLQQLKREEELIEEERLVACSKAEKISEAIAEDGELLLQDEWNGTTVTANALEPKSRRKQKKAAVGADLLQDKWAATASGVDAASTPHMEGSTADGETCESFTRDQLGEIAEAVETMAGGSPVAKERAEIESLEKEREQKRESIEAAKTTSKQVGFLDSRVSSLLSKLRQELEETETDIGQAFHALDLDGDGIMSHDELLNSLESLHLSKRPDAASFRKFLLEMDVDCDGKISVADFRRLVEEMQMRSKDHDDHKDAKEKSAKERSAAASEA